MWQQVIFRDLGKMDYQSAWNYQESLLQENVRIKSAVRNETLIEDKSESPSSAIYPEAPALETKNYLLFTEHPPVFTLGKSGNMSNVLLSEERQREKGIGFFKTNRGGDITFHGPDQLVGYPILDLEKFDTDIGHYLRNLEEVVIIALAAYGIRGGRSKGETGVWIDPEIKGRERKICAIGVRCSRWITMHGFALNVNTDLSYFNYIVPCGIANKQVTSLEKETGKKVGIEDVKESVKRAFETVFNVTLIEAE